MIVTGESSGELYGALLAGKLKALWPDVRVLGVGGERMRQAGVEVFSGIAGAFGLTEAISSLSAVRNTYKETIRTMSDTSPDVVVLIDYPDFNFRVARKARELGVRVLYYVSPQVWAWRSGRVREMAGFVDMMAVVLPFEERIYRVEGIWCEFVGHPILDEMDSLEKDKNKAKEMLGLDVSRSYLALLPGSRRSELKRLLPVMLDVVREFKSEYPDYGFFMPVAPDIDMGNFKEYFDELRKEGVEAKKENAVLALTASEAAVITSGTATLQATFRNIPMVVIYKLFPLTYLVARLLIKAKYATIANLILGREAVPELLQRRANKREIMNHLRELISDGERRQRTIEDLESVRAYFRGKTPSLRVAEITGEMAGWRA
jgi:lipid-A-disaccharide synthase